MGGIAGLSLPAGAAPDPAVLARLAAALAHRGPDGAGHAALGNVLLVQTRLATVDPATGDQPLFAGPAALVADGAICNHRALRAALADAAFVTGSDCEPPLHLYLRDGAGFVDALRGVYALALHDRARRTLMLARDPFGVRPLYVADSGGGLAFASEPQALVAAGLVAPRVRAGARGELLQMQFTTGAETIFAGIRRLLPGETITVSDGRIVERRRRAALAAGGPEGIDGAAALARLDAALAESVALHGAADVPCGVLLTGGLGAAAILALMARGGRPVPAFAARFDASGAPDEDDAIAAAGARLERVTITEAEIWRHLPAIVGAMDDPAADYAIIPAWFLARRARGEVKVVLSGEGADELLAGHGRYRAAMRPWWRGGRVMRARGTFDRLDVLRARPAGWRDGIAAAEAREAGGGRARLQVAQAADIADWLPNGPLLRLDRCLMAHGLEGRAPFLDPAVAAATFRLPDVLKVRGRRGKWLLREWLAQHLPQARPFAPRPGGAVPVGAWIAARGSRLGALVAADPAIAEIAAPDRVVALFRAAAGRREGFAAWTLLFYALWHRRHVRGLLPEGDVFDTLSAGG